MIHGGDVGLGMLAGTALLLLLLETKTKPAKFVAAAASTFATKGDGGDTAADSMKQRKDVQHPVRFRRSRNEAASGHYNSNSSSDNSNTLRHRQQQQRRYCVMNCAVRGSKKDSSRPAKPI